MKILQILILLVAIHYPLQAQLQNYQPGYYLSQAGDTIQTELSQEGSYYVNLRVREDRGEVRSLSTSTVRGFGFPEQGVHYRPIPHTFTSEEGEEITTSRFARVLVDGANKLYRLEQEAEEYFHELSDIRSYVYYLQRPSGEVYKLERVEEQSTQSRFRVLEKYRGALRYLFVDWPEVTKRTERLNFRDEDMAEIVRDYNVFIDPTDDGAAFLTSDKRRIWHEFSVSAAGRSLENGDKSRSSLTGSYSLRFRNALKSNSLTLGVGVGAMLIPASGTDVEDEWFLRVPLEAGFLLTHKSKFRPTLSIFMIPTYGQESRTTAREIIRGGETVTIVKSFTGGSLDVMSGPGISVRLGPVGVNLRLEYSLLTALSSRVRPAPLLTFIGLSYELGRKE